MVPVTPSLTSSISNKLFFWGAFSKQLVEVDTVTNGAPSSAGYLALYSPYQRAVFRSTSLLKNINIHRLIGRAVEKVSLTFISVPLLTANNRHILNHCPDRLEVEKKVDDIHVIFPL